MLITFVLFPLDAIFFTNFMWQYLLAVLVAPFCDGFGYACNSSFYEEPGMLLTCKSYVLKSTSLQRTSHQDKLLTYY